MPVFGQLPVFRVLFQRIELCSTFARARGGGVPWNNTYNHSDNILRRFWRDVKRQAAIFLSPATLPATPPRQPGRGPYGGSGTPSYPVEVHRITENSASALVNLLSYYFLLQYFYLPYGTSTYHAILVELLKPPGPGEPP